MADLSRAQVAERVGASRDTFALTPDLDLPSTNTRMAAAPVYGVTIAIDLSTGSTFRITITDQVAFLVSNPTKVPPTSGQRIIITLVNGAGAAIGAASFGTQYHVSGGATGFAGPTGTSASEQSIEFENTAAVGATPVWRETWRSVGNILT